MNPVDRTDVDHARRTLGRTDGVEQWAKELRQVKDTLHVEREHALPRLLVVVVHRRAPRGTGVVNEDVEMVLARGDLVSESSTLGFARQVGRNRDTGAVVRELLRAAASPDFGLTRRDVHRGAGVDEAPRDHLANTATSAGYQYDLARNVKERTHLRSVNHQLTRIGGGRLVRHLESHAGTGEFRVQLVRAHERLVGVVGLDDHLGHSSKGSPQRTRNLTGPVGVRLVVDAEVRDSDGDDVSLGSGDVLRVNRPHADVREVERALDLALVYPLEVTHDVRVIVTSGATANIRTRPVASPGKTSTMTLKSPLEADGGALLSL